MIQWFFPSLFTNVLLNEHNWMGNYLLELLAPRDSIRNCPEITWNVGTTTGAAMSIRQPNLFVAATIGAWIGIFGGVWLLQLIRTRRSQLQPRHQQQQTTMQFLQQLFQSTHVWWFVAAFVCYGSMNLSALLLHCVLPAPTSSTSTYLDDAITNRNLPLQIGRRQLCWMLDCIFTGCSSTCLSIASILEITSKMKMMKKKNTTRILHPRQHCIFGGKVLLCWLQQNVSSSTIWKEKCSMGILRRILYIHFVYLVVAIVSYVTCQVTLLLELWYVVPIFFATIFVTTWFAILSLASSMSNNTGGIDTTNTKKNDDDDYDNDDKTDIATGTRMSRRRRQLFLHSCCFVIFISGGLISVSGIVFDANRCRRNSSDGGSSTNFDWISASAWTFYGINVSFLAILFAKLLHSDN